MRALADQSSVRYALIDACSRDADMPCQVPAGRPPELLADASAHLYGVAAARSSAWRRSGPLGAPRRACVAGML